MSFASVQTQENSSIEVVNQVTQTTTTINVKDIDIEPLNTKEIKKDVVPDVVGYGLTDAVYLLKGLWLNVRVSGQGTVIAQSLKEGHEIKKGETITLTLSPLKGKNQKKEEPKDTVSAVPLVPKDSVKTEE